MSEAQHTPGPWMQVAGSNFVYALNEDGSNRFDLRVNAGYIKQPRKGAGEKIPVSEQEIKSTISLIAAAPELREALNEFPCDADYPTAEDFRDACKQWWKEYAWPAFAKASGKEVEP